MRAPGETFRTRGMNRIRGLALALAAGLGLAAGAAVAAGQAERAGRVDEEDAGEAAKVLRVAVVQFRATMEVEANAPRMAEFIAEAARAGAQVAVFPECALSGYTQEKNWTVEQDRLERGAELIGAACQDYGIYAIVGSPWWEEGKLMNSALVFAPDGKMFHRYDKIQLAEEWPAEGSELSVFFLAGTPCAIIICHDERYPELVRLPVLAGARVVFYISHEAGVAKESKLGPYRAQIQARAVENNVWVVQSNAPANADASGSHGQSRVVAPDGNVMQEATVFQEEMLVVDLDLSRSTGEWAGRSVERGPLGDWWRAGVSRVRVVQP